MGPANRFTRAGTVGNPCEFTQLKGKSRKSQRPADLLIRNSIFCWNYLYLAVQLEKAPDEGSHDNLFRAIAAHAPVAWGHINQIEAHDFAEENLKDVLGILLPKSAS